MSARIVAFVALLLIGLTTRHWAGPAHADSFPNSITSACSGRCAATVLAGIQLETSMEEVFGVRGEFTPPWGYEFSKGFFLGGTFSFELFDFNSLIGFKLRPGSASVSVRCTKRKSGGPSTCGGSTFPGTT